MKFIRLAMSAGILAMLAAPALAAGAPIQVARIGGHQILTDAKGMTLYTFDKDSPGVSTCYGLCAFAWPPARATKGYKPAGRFTIVPRRGGGAVWAYKDAPLYRFFQDRKPGDLKGDGVDGVWHAAVK